MPLGTCLSFFVILLLNLGWIVLVGMCLSPRGVEKQLRWRDILLIGVSCALAGAWCWYLWGVESALAQTLGK